MSDVRDPFELLSEEHRLIERVMDALDGYVDGDANAADLAGFVTFFQEFADKKHHAKEEEILFVAMNDHGFPRDTGPVAVMLSEHDQGRGHIADLAAATDLATTRRAAHAFTSLLRAHIQKEDNILYPMAQTHLPAPVLATIAQRCHDVEQAFTNSQTLTTLADELITRYAP